MKVLKQIILIGAIVPLICFSGCAGVPKYMVGEFKQPPKISIPHHKPSVLIATSLTEDQVPHDQVVAAQDLFAGVVQRETAAIAENFQEFAVEPAGLPHATLRIRLDLTERANLVTQALTSLLGGATLSVIPTFVTTHFTLIGTVETLDGKVLQKVELHDDLRFWVQLFLIFGPNRPLSTVQDFVANMVRAFYSKVDWAAL